MGKVGTPYGKQGSNMALETPIPLTETALLTKALSFAK